MNYVVYSIAVLIIILLICFVFLSINWLKKKVLHNIRSKTIGLMATYDNLLDKKSRDLETLGDVVCNDSIESNSGLNNNVNHDVLFKEQQQFMTTIVNLTKRNSQTLYVSTDFSENYKYIRKNFKFDIHNLIEKSKALRSSDDENALYVLSNIEYDTFYKLSTLGSNDQIELLNSCGDSRLSLCVDEYNKLVTKFDSLAFYDYLHEKAYDQSQKVDVKVPSFLLDNNINNTDVTVKLDDDICEGFQIETGKYLYDYSIRAGEMF